MRTPASLLVDEANAALAEGTAESNDRAVGLFEQALGADPHSAPAYIGLANAYLDRVDDLRNTREWLDRALAAGETAIKLDPTADDAYLALGIAYRIKGSLRQELQLWQHRLELAPHDAVARTRGGWVLWFSGQPDGAVRWLEDAVAQQSGSEYVEKWAHFFLGNANLSLGDFAEAERMYAAQLALNPDHSSAQAGVIWSLLARGQDDEARSQLHGFRTGSFDGDRVSLKLADIEYFLREDEIAAEHAREALSEPDARYWPRGFLASTILGALFFESDRATADEYLTSSEEIDRERLQGGDEGYMPHVDLAAVAAIRGDSRAAWSSLQTAVTAGWRYPTLAARDRLFENVQGDDRFRTLASD
jgi:tetratricopeptide (TPR) repeat protein